MSITEIKARLKALIEVSEDKAILETQLQVISASLESKDAAWWASLPIAKREGLRRSLEESKQGEVIAHEEVMAEFSKWL